MGKRKVQEHQKIIFGKYNEAVTSVYKICKQMLNLNVLTIFVHSVTGISPQQNTTLFKLLWESKTGISLNNQLSKNEIPNILNQVNTYNSRGVGIGDFNQDCLHGYLLYG